MKKIYTVLILSFTFFQAFGQVVIGPQGGVVPLGSYPAYYNQYLKGGFKSGADIASRDAYPMNLRDTESFIFFTESDSKFWILKGGTANSNWVELTISGPAAGIIRGSTFPSSKTAGDLFYHTAQNRLYVYNDTDWIPADNVLADGQLYVGNSNGLAAAVTMSGDVTITNTGTTTIADNAVTSGKIAGASVDISKLKADPVTGKNKIYATDASGVPVLIDQSALTGGATPSGPGMPAENPENPPVIGRTYYNTSNNQLYVYTGTSWVAVKALSNGMVYVGNTDGIAMPVTMSGDVTIANSGVTIIADNAVTSGKIAGASVDISKLKADPVTGKNKIYATDASGVPVLIDQSALTGGTTPSGPGIPAENPENPPVTGSTYYNTSNNQLYVYTGTSWVAVKALNNGMVYVGNTDGIAVPVTMSGDVTITNGGATIIADNAVTSSKIAQATVDISRLKADPATDKDMVFATDADGKPVLVGRNSIVDAAKDNMGNHTATAGLKMSSFSISNDGDAGDGLTFDLAGNAYFGQDVTVNNNLMTPSDRRLKTKIETLRNVLGSIDQMRGVQFEYIDKKKYAKGPKIGVIAQELLKVYPGLVAKGVDGFYKVDYTQLTGILIQGLKELKTVVQDQRLEIELLKDQAATQQKQIETILKKLEGQ